MNSTGIETLTTAALLGTARATPTFDSLHTADAAESAIGTAEHRLLAAAALESVFLAGGALPTPRPRPAAAPDDPRPELPPAATERLRGLLAIRSDLIDEWFSAAAHFKAPAELIVDLLDRTSAAGGAHRSALIALAGPRGRWVAAQNPVWAPLVEPDLNDDDMWLHGTPARRRAWFQNLRAADPAAATARLAAVWQSENAATRLTLFEALSPGLGGHDEELLERALDDRSGRVREVAIRFLRRLPDSAFGRRMTQRVHDWTRVHDGTQVDGSTLAISLPDTLDAHAVRDGLDVRGPSRLGTVDAHRAWSLAASAPLAAWCGPDRSPEDVLALQVADELRDAVRTGWETATADQVDEQWASAMLRRDGKVDELVAGALPRSVLIEHLRGASGSQLLDTILLDALPAPWPVDVAEKVLAALYTAAAPKSTTFRSLTTLLAHRAPYEVGDLFADAATRTDDLDRLNRFATAADILSQRRTLHEELS
ncbi:DUF5691 domain-containing protein [Rhodococcus artemisiae]|uniref:DUF5691 domain-containing protein n=1 Tax=Rhodococcus artemisiae TaxID=714159 RepID=A0ABU7LEE6_9NOCA|nr:DUF5691 domain-containing protein [Rhodococcus artemisiae]MEE2059913.1 DUF5691 domain-containing protein [Rhodococcus artemisiae]